MRVDEHVLEVGKLAADFIDSHAVRPVAGEPQTGACFDGLLLLGVAGENDLGAALLSDAKEIVEFRKYLATGKLPEPSTRVVRAALSGEGGDDVGF